MATTPAKVKQLREMTDLGMMDCKRALDQTGGEIESALEILRKSGLLKAAKREGKVTAEGLIIIETSADLHQAVMMEVNCETDFVARDSGFTEFAQHIGKVALANRIGDVQTLLNAQYDDARSIDQARQELVARVGENITLRRIVFMESGSPLAFYSHGGRIAALVEIQGGQEELRKDIAMHVVASNPLVVLPEHVPADKVAKEREIYIAQAANSGKPAEIVAKMVDGKIKKFLEEMSLVSQPFVKNPDQKVSDYLKQHQATVISFARFAVGEGIEKPISNFAEEVRAQTGQ